MNQEIKDFAIAKVYSNLVKLAFKVDDVKKDIETKFFGVITEDELKIVLKGLQKEEKVWNYILKALEDYETRKV